MLLPERLTREQLLAIYQDSEDPARRIEARDRLDAMRNARKVAVKTTNLYGYVRVEDWRVRAYDR